MINTRLELLGKLMSRSILPTIGDFSGMRSSTISNPAFFNVISGTKRELGRSDSMSERIDLVGLTVKSIPSFRKISSCLGLFKRAIVRPTL